MRRMPRRCHPSSLPPKSKRIWRLTAVAALLTALCVCQNPAQSQQRNGPLAPPGSAFINLTSVRSTRLSNAVRVELRFDGTVQVFADPIANGWIDFPNDELKLFPVSVIKFRVVNARSQAGAFFDISVYPVSHVEVSIPIGAKEGVGLDVAIPLYTPAWFKGIETRENSWSGWETEKLPTFYIQESQDHRSIIVTVASDRQSEPPLRLKTPEDAASLHQELDVALVDGVLQVSALNVSLHSFAEALSAATGIRITVDDEVRKTVSLYLPATDVEEVIDTLCRGYGLSAAQVGDSIVISQASPSSGSRFATVQTRLIPLNYLKARDAVDLLPTFTRRFVRESDEHNAIMVSAPDYLADKIQADLSKLDKPAPQISVQLTAVEFSDRSDIEAAFGITAKAQSLTAATDSNTGDVWFSTLGNAVEEYSARIRGLCQSGKAKLVASSQATVLNGEKATLFVGAKKLIQVRVTTWRGRQEEILMDVNIGTRLNVVPWTGGSGDITVKLTPEVSNVVSLDPQTGMPTLQIRRYEGTMRVADGDTVVIGGLKQTVDIPSRRRIPFLGHIPIIGALFTKKARSIDRSEMVLLLTAKVVNPEKISPKANQTPTEPAKPR
jgi:hypothetical protein